VSVLLAKDLEFSFGGGDPMPRSWFAMPAWREPAWLDEPPAARRGTLERHELSSGKLPAKLPVSVYLPAGYAAGTARYPVVFVHAGAPNAHERGHWPTALDNLIGSTVEPLIVVFIAPVGLPMPQYVEYFAQELVPWVDSTYRTKAEPAQRANVGMANSGVAAFFCTFSQPGLVGKLGTQSAWLFEWAWNDLATLVKPAQQAPLDLYLDWGTWDMHNPVENWHVGEINAKVADFLRERGYRPAGGEVHDVSGWASWSLRTGALLQSLFPAGG
jgi:enterochelin esterase-like enzyme